MVHCRLTPVNRRARYGGVERVMTAPNLVEIEDGSNSVDDAGVEPTRRILPAPDSYDHIILAD